MSDVAILINDDCEFDIDFTDTDFAIEEGLETAVFISWFTDRRADLEDLANASVDRRGYWGDMFPEVDNDQIGSKFWTRFPGKATRENRVKIESDLRESLEWMIEDGISDEINVSASFFGSEGIRLEASIKRPDTDKPQIFSFVWNGQIMKRGRSGV